MYILPLQDTVAFNYILEMTALTWYIYHRQKRDALFLGLAGISEAPLGILSKAQNDAPVFCLQHFPLIKSLILEETLTQQWLIMTRKFSHKL